MANDSGMWASVRHLIDRLAEQEVNALVVVVLLLMIAGREGVGLWLKWRRK